MKKLLRSLLAVMLISMMAVSLASCAAKPDKIKDQLKDLDYEVELIDDEDDIEEYTEELDIDGVTAILEAYGEDEDGGYVSIIWFEKKADAEDALETIEDFMDEMGEYMPDYEVEQKGTIIIMGMGDAYDDAADLLKI